MSVQDDARALTIALLEAGRDPMWSVLLIAWYYGQQGREEALKVVEEYQAALA